MQARARRRDLHQWRPAGFRPCIGTTLHSDLCCICRRLISHLNVLIMLSVGVNSTQAPTSGFAWLVTEKSQVHTSWRGFTTITHLLAPNPTFPLVTRLALCSRPGAALLNVVASTLKSRETRLALSILADLRVKDPTRGPCRGVRHMQCMGSLPNQPGRSVTAPGAVALPIQLVEPVTRAVLRRRSLCRRQLGTPLRASAACTRAAWLRAWG